MADLVELIGLPGSGKSTLAADLERELASRGVAVSVYDKGSELPPHFSEISKLRRRVEIGRWLLSHRGFAAAVTARSTSKGAVKEMMRLLLREMRRRGLTRATPDVVILDEGALHKLIMLYAEGLVPRVEGLLSHLAEPSFCVSLAVPVEVAVPRLRSRMTSPVDSRPIRDLETYLARYATFQEWLVRSLPCPVIELGAGDIDVSDLADRILRARSLRENRL